VGDEQLDSPMEVCKCHTVFRKAMPTGVFPLQAAPENLLTPELFIVDACAEPPSRCASPPFSAELVPLFTQFRQFLQYPAVDEEARAKFHKTLTRYRLWEVDRREKIRAIMAGPETKGKKDKKGSDKKADKKGGEKDKGKDGKKKGKTSSGQSDSSKLNSRQISRVNSVDQETGQNYLPDAADFKPITAFELEVHTLLLRQDEKSMPTNPELLDLALKARHRPGSAPQEDGDEVQAADAEVAQMSGVDDSGAGGSTSPGAGRAGSAAGSQALSQKAQSRGPSPEIGVEDGAAPRSQEATDGASVGGVRSMAGSPTQAADAAEEDNVGMSEGTRVGSPTVSRQESAAARKIKVQKAQVPTFAYFESDLGLQFLLDTGELDPECRPAAPKKTGKTPNRAPQEAPAEQTRNPWNPRLVGEETPPESPGRSQSPRSRAAGSSRSCGQEHAPPSHQGRMDAEADQFGDDREGEREGTQQYPFQPDVRGGTPVMPEMGESPRGPHPDKKSTSWDVYGERRPPKPPVSQAYVELNTDYLQVEGATDRRVRTMSIAHKKNAAKAPSVSSVRKTGTYAMGTGTELAAQEVLGDLGPENHAQQWQLTATMQGLGDSDRLVEVTPGICRFGPLRCGAVYRMSFWLRNLDVDLTRFNVARLESEFVSIRYQPGQIAPGMAARIVVEIAASMPARIEQLVEVRVKAHIVRVPITARVFDEDEYDRLDAESLALHGRRIGRHQPEHEGKSGPVEVVDDETYSLKALGKAYRPAPADEELLPSS